jgi:hypothetical protein
MTNADRRRLLEEFRASGMEGSILDVYKAYAQGTDLLAEHRQQQEQAKPLVAETPEQQKEGLRPYHKAGEFNQTMVFPDVPPNTPFNTIGMKAPINIKKVDEQGHLIQSYENVPPGITNLPTGPNHGTVIETPATYQKGGEVKKMQTGGAKDDNKEEKQKVSLTWSEKHKLDKNTVPGTRIMTFEDGTQMPVLLGTAEVVAKKDRKGLDSVEDAVKRTGSGIVGDYAKTDKSKRKKFESGVREDINTAGNNMINVATDAMSWPGRVTTGALLNAATGKKINTNPFAYTDAARGIKQENYSPSTTLGLTGAKAVAADIAFDPAGAFMTGKGALGLFRAPARFGLTYSKVPFGYGKKSLGPKETLQSVFSKKKQVENVFRAHRGRGINPIVPYDRIPKNQRDQIENRIDAVRLSLGKEQRYGSYKPSGVSGREVKLRDPDQLDFAASNVGDIQIPKAVKKDLIARGKWTAPLSDEWKHGPKIPFGEHLAAGKASLKGNKGVSVGYTDDLYGVMGGYRIETTPMNKGMRVDMVDDWDLQPFQQGTTSPLLDRLPNRAKKAINKLPERAKNKLFNTEVFETLGGKPIRIRQSFDVHADQGRLNISLPGSSEPLVSRAGASRGPQPINLDKSAPGYISFEDMKAYEFGLNSLKSLRRRGGMIDRRKKRRKRK